MKLAEKIVDSTIGLKLKSGTNFEIHVIKYENGETGLILENLDEAGQRLVLVHQEVSDFMALLNDFLHVV
ncbi:MAG: hypothetical protein ACFE95_14960 [Candidatus Hodarchaeota archaeon]